MRFVSISRNRTLQGGDRFAIALPRTALEVNRSGALPCSPVAQLVEQAAVNRFVAGSSPARGAIFLFSDMLWSNQDMIRSGQNVTRKC